ncbi:MAG: hypothetical protein ABI831_24660 [Betaproteobacteria bacterium]
MKRVESRAAPELRGSAAGELITTFTEQMLQSPIGRGLVALPVTKAPMTLELRLFFRRSALISPATQKFRSALPGLLAAER